MKIAVLLCLFNAAVSLASADPDPLVAAVRKTLEEMVRADTSNPPGNEARIAQQVAERLKAEGVPYEIVGFGPGRESIVARLKGDGSGGKPVLLLAHLDVVGVQDQKWTSDPHVMVEKDGFLVGRGVSDDLGMAAMELEVFLELKRSGQKLRRDVILALTGDEEKGGGGLRHILAEKPELVDAAVAINEGGAPVLGQDGKVQYIGLQTAEKTYQDFQLTAQGPTGHSSMPQKDNAIYRLARALDRVGKAEMPPTLHPTIRRYLERRAALEPPRVAAAMRTLAKSKGKPPKGPLAVVESDPLLSSILRTTCVATMVQGGTKENALPPEARANVNCRILPSESVAEVQARLAAAIRDPEVKIKPVSEFGVAGGSPIEGEGPAAIEKVAGKMWPGAPVIPMMSRWATDSRFLRMKGIAAYGVSPIAMTEADASRAHGIDERIPTASLKPGVEFLHQLVLELAKAN